MKKTNKYAHIKSMKDLDNEIVRLKIKKTIIKEEIGNNFVDLKESLRPINLLKDVFNIGDSNRFAALEDNDNIFNNGKIFTYMKYVALLVSTVKGGTSLVRKVKRIFR